MKDKSSAVDAFAGNARITEIAVRYVTFAKRMVNSKSSIVSEATNEA